MADYGFQTISDGAAVGISLGTSLGASLGASLGVSLGISLVGGVGIYVHVPPKTGFESGGSGIGARVGVGAAVSVVGKKLGTSLACSVGLGDDVGTNQTEIWACVTVAATRATATAARKVLDRDMIQFVCLCVCVSK